MCSQEPARLYFFRCSPCRRHEFWSRVSAYLGLVCCIPASGLLFLRPWRCRPSLPCFLLGPADALVLLGLQITALSFCSLRLLQCIATELPCSQPGSLRLRLCTYRLSDATLSWRTSTRGSLGAPCICAHFVPQVRFAVLVPFSGFGLVHDSLRASRGWLPFLCQVLLGHSLPHSVWAAPGGADGAAALTASLATHGPVGHPSDSAALSPALSSTGVSLPGVPANTIDAAQLATGSADPNLHCLVFAAGYRTEHLVLDVPCDITADALVARVQVASALVQRLSPAHLFPAHPQPGQGYASFVVVPDWVPADRRQVVLLDFSRMHGPVFGHVFHNPLTYRDLVTEAVAQTDELWHAYIPNSFEPLAVGCEVTLSSGDVISFSPRDVPLARDSDLTLLLSRPSSWQREPDHVLLERPTSAWLVILPQSVQSFPFYGTFTADLQQAIADQMDSQVQHVSFGHPTEPLTDVVYRGRLYDKIAAADHRSENLPPGPNLGAFVFLDARQSARGLGFLFEGHGAVVPTQDGVRVLGLRPPRGFRTYAEHVFLRREGLPVVDGCVLVLGYEFDEDTVGTVPASAAPGVILLLPPMRGSMALLLAQPAKQLPPPSALFCTFIALPLWATHVVCVVVDARAVDGRLFAMHLDNGLPDMLYQLDGWHLPVPDFKGFLQTPFYLLTDAWNTVADFPASASTSYTALRQFATAFLRYEDHRSSLQTLHPRVADYNFHGIVCRAVLIATEQPIGLPVPPARARPPCIAYAVDRRAILADITWHITPTGRVDLDSLMREFEPAPSGFYTSITGGLPECEGARTFLRVDNGQVLTVAYEEDLLEPDRHGDSTPPDDEPDDSDSSSTSSALPATPKPAPRPMPGARNRKRRLTDGTPGAGASSGPTVAVNVFMGCLVSAQVPAAAAVLADTPSHRQGLGILATHSHLTVLRYSWGFLVDVLLFVVLWLSCGLLVCTAASCRQAKLLLEPRAHNSPMRHALAALRYFAPRLGGAWRYIPAADAEVIPGSSGSEEGDETPEDGLALFAVLAPGYAPEQVAVIVQFPATLTEALDTVQLARHSIHKHWLPVPVPVEPQPQPGIGTVIALADWQRQDRFVCIDSTQLDGRRFVVQAPHYADKLALLHLADIQLNLGIAVYIGDDPQPLGDDVQVQLWTGLAVFFLPPERHPPALQPPPDAYALVYHDEVALHITDRCPGVSSFWISVPYFVGGAQLSLRIIGWQACLHDVGRDVIDVHPGLLSRAMHGFRSAVRLIAAYPQTIAGAALLLALPFWTPDGVTVACDLTRLTGVVFALQLPRVVRRDGLLRALGVATDARVDLYLRDLPWPMPHGAVYDLRNGDTVVVTPAAQAAHAPIPTGSLSARLASAAAWDPTWGPDATYADTVWLLTEVGHFTHVVPPGRRSFFRDDVAALLGVRADRITFAAPDPAIRDHAEKGVLSLNVIAVLGDEPPDLEVRQGGSLCFIDSRPILTGISRITVHGGGLDTARLHRRFDPRCPVGYRLCRLHPDHGPCLLPPVLNVQHGEVIVLSFMPAEANPINVPPEDGPGPGQGGAPRGPAAAPPAGDAASPPATDNPTSSTGQTDAGTGGTQRARDGPSFDCIGLFSARRQPHSEQCVSRVVTWRQASSVSYLAFTSILLHLVHWGLCALRGAASTAGSHLVAPAVVPRRGRHRPSPGRRLCRPTALILVLIVAAALPLAAATTSGGTPPGAVCHSFCGSGLAYAVGRLSRPVATPCRAPAAVGHPPGTADPTGALIRLDTATHGFELPNDLPTLLDLAARQDNTWALRAVTLLEGLFRHGDDGDDGTPSSPSVAHEPAAEIPRPSPIIQLASTVPLTAYQSSCLELQALVPPVAAATAVDWLDNDLRPLLTAPDTSPEVRHAIPAITNWHTAGGDGSLLPALVHIYTDGSARGTHEPLASAPCGWAFNVWIETASGWYFYGFAAGTAVPPFTRFHLGEMDDSPLTSELLGAAWALVWAAEYGPTFACPLHLHYDCAAAGEGTFAQAVPASVPTVTGGPSLSHVAVALRHIAAARVALTSAYVPGHRGALGNEISDSLAKYIRRQALPLDERVHPDWPAHLVQHELLDWAWLAHACAADLPTLFAFESEAGRLQALCPQPRPAPHCGVTQTADDTVAPVRYCIKAVTFNILTLLESTHAKRRVQTHAGLRMMGRRHVILRQLQSQDVLFAGLQETRVQDTALLPDRTHILLHSGASEAGHYGCALWISKTVPYAHVNGKPMCIEPRHCTVSATSPRHLVVCVEAPHLRLGVLVVHAPSDPHDDKGVLHAFWAARTLELGKLPNDVPVLLLADANSRLGSLESEAVGPHHPEDETPAASHFHSFLLRNGLWLPATFAGLHSGPSWTWQSPRGDQHRLDYIGLPQSWATFSCRSRVWYTFEALQQRSDHLPVIIECSFARESSSRASAAFRRVACRPNDLDPTIDKQAFCHALSAAPPVDWSVNVDSHYCAFVSNWTAAGRAQQPRSTPKPQQSFLTAPTLAIIRRRKDTRIALRAAEKELHRRLLVAGFAAFTHLHAASALNTGSAAATWAWIRGANHNIALAWSRLHRLCTEARQAVKADRCHYLQKLVSEVGQADLRDPRHLYQCVRRAFPKAASAKRSRFTPLPAVALADGTLAVTGAERAARWRSHFAAQEGGVDISPADYSAGFAVDAARSTAPAVFDPRLLPSLTELETSVLQLKRGKAAGPDGVTSELLKLAVPTAARQLLPLFVKSLLTVREPIEFKGGALMTLTKKAASAFECDRYRSILLSSVPGKLLHKSLRRRITPLLLQHSPDLMGGVHPGVGVDSIATAVRSYQAHVHASGEHPAVVFFDVRAAYYQVVRETLTSDAPDDSILQSLFCKLGVPPDALAELRDHLASLNHLIDSNGSLHLEAFTRELFKGTWFRLDQHVDLVATSAGVRPGDPLADVFFALSFSAYLRSVQAFLRQQSLSTVLPPCTTLLPVDGLETERELSPASWADDFAAMLSATSPAQVVRKVQATTSAFLTHATAIGMQLSFAVDKTAALLPPTVLFADVCDLPPSGAAYEHAILVYDSIALRTVHLPAVQAYKHLGGIVTCNAPLLPEIYYRFSQCTWTLRPLRGTLFGNPSIPLPLRRALLGSLVATKFTYGSATMELHVAYQWRLWARLYTSIWKALQPRSSAADKIHSYEVLRQANALAPPLALAKARASLYLRVLEHGPQTLLHLWWLQWEATPARSWLAMLQGDLEYVAMYCPAVQLLLDSPCPLVALTETMLQDRTWWRRQLNAAARIYFADLERWAQGRRNTAACPLIPPPSADAYYRCPFCTASFPLKKHLSVHIARHHGLPAPKRLFAPHATCLACLKHFHSIPRLQNHLKSVPRCLERVHLLMPPLELSAVRAIEQADRAHQKRLKTGCWQAFDANKPVLQALGPLQPTRAELLSALGEEAPLSLLAQPPPNPAFTAWVCNDIHGRTREPPRAGTRSFWWQRIQ
ncbi:CFDP2 [Symbiodinium sp. CCMP2592]|nr:CFDP2 [Symbiodinium sp. CCMP2592]